MTNRGTRSRTITVQQITFQHTTTGAEKSRSRIMAKWIGQLEKCRQDDSLLLYFFDKTNVDFPNWHATSHQHHLSPGFASVWSSRRLLNGRCPCCSHCPGGLLFFFSSLLVVHLNQSMFRFRHSWIEINRIKQQTKYETSSDQIRVTICRHRYVCPGYHCSPGRLRPKRVETIQLETVTQPSSGSHSTSETGFYFIIIYDTNSSSFWQSSLRLRNRTGTPRIRWRRKVNELMLTRHNNNNFWSLH